MRKDVIFICSLVLCLFIVSGCKRPLKATRQEIAQEELVIGYAVGYNPRIAEIQLLLKQAGFDPGVIDGTMNSSTRKAVFHFQESKELRATGVVDDKTWVRLQSFAIVPVEEFVQTQERAQVVQPPVIPVQPEVKIPERPTVRDIQRALKNAGYDPGPIDGIIGRRTKRAIIDFQKANRLSPDGIVGRKTWGKLGPHLR